MGLGPGPAPSLQRSTRCRRLDPHHRHPRSTVAPGASPSGAAGPAIWLNARRAPVTCDHAWVKVILRNPRREIELSGPKTVINLLAELDLNREAHLVMRDGELIPGDAALSDDDVIEVRPVISGGER